MAWTRGHVPDFTEDVDSRGGFFQGKCLHSFEDIGYSNVDQVIAELVRHLPDTIPLRSMVQFKIVNLDNDKVAMYERMKGKGF